MGYYIEAIRAAVDSSSPLDLRPALEFLVGLAREEYAAGALDAAELEDIVAEYDAALSRAS